jgi:hypothetical protein
MKICQWPICWLAVIGRLHKWTGEKTGPLPWSAIRPHLVD